MNILHTNMKLLKDLIRRDLIRRGILRIFPSPQKVIVIVVVIVSALLISCGSQKTVTQTVTDIRGDTVYINTFQQDSVYIYENKLIDRSRDTIFIRDMSVEFRYRKLTAPPLRIVQRDSIPYEVTVTEVKEIQRSLTLFDKLCRACFWFLATCMSLFIAHKLRR